MFCYMFSSWFVAAVSFFFLASSCYPIFKSCFETNFLSSVSGNEFSDFEADFIDIDLFYDALFSASFYLKMELGLGI